MHVVLDLGKRTRKFFEALGTLSRACRPTVVSPISPPISARGTNAATESMTTQSIAPRSDEHTADFKRLLSEVGLGDEHVIDSPRPNGLHRPGRAHVPRR